MRFPFRLGDLFFSLLGLSSGLHEQRIVHVRPIVVKERRVVVPDVGGIVPDGGSDPFIRVGYGAGVCFGVIL